MDKQLPFAYLIKYMCASCVQLLVFPLEVAHLRMNISFLEESMVVAHILKLLLAV
jgi:hypothetical protein